MALKCLKIKQILLSSFHDRMAERSKALVLGTSHFGGAGSNPVPVRLVSKSIGK